MTRPTGFLHRWTSLLAEAVVVVTSILLAFALDAWWDGRRDTEAFQEALGGVRVELSNNRDLLEQEMGTLDRIMTAGEVALDSMYAHQEEASVELADTLAFLVSYWAPSLEVSLGAVDALIASGRLAEIEDGSLRLGLAGLRDRFADVVEDELVGRQIHVEQQGPLLNRLFDLRELSAIDLEFFSGLDKERTAVPHFGPTSYPNSTELRNLIYSKVSWYGSARGEIRKLIEHITGLIALTELEMG